MFNRTKSRWETSTHRTAHLTAAQIWEIGYRHVEDASRNRSIKARADGAFKVVVDRGLRLDVNGEPYPRHVDIVAWPEEKHARLMTATEIAVSLKLEVDPRR